MTGSRVQSVRVCSVYLEMFTMNQCYDGVLWASMDSTCMSSSCALEARR
jgi:hypothetical protein